MIPQVPGPEGLARKKIVIRTTPPARFIEKQVKSSQVIGHDTVFQSPAGDIASNSNMMEHLTCHGG